MPARLRRPGSGCSNKSAMLKVTHGVTRMPGARRRILGDGRIATRIGVVALMRTHQGWGAHSDLPWDFDRDPAAAAFVISGVDVAAVSAHDAPRDRQPESGAVGFRREERVEDVTANFLWECPGRNRRSRFGRVSPDASWPIFTLRRPAPPIASMAFSAMLMRPESSSPRSASNVSIAGSSSNSQLNVEVGRSPLEVPLELVHEIAWRSPGRRLILPSR